MKTETTTTKNQWLLHANGQTTQNPSSEQIKEEAFHWMTHSEEKSSRHATVWYDDEANEWLVETIHFNQYDSTIESRFASQAEAESFCGALNEKRLNAMIQSLPILNLPASVVDIHLGKVTKGQFPQERKCDIILSLSNGQTLEDDAHWTAQSASDNGYRFDRIEKTIEQMVNSAV